MSETLIGRRNAIGKISFAGVALLAGSRCGDGTTTGPSESTDTTASTTSSNAACVLTPALTEGPFYFDAGQIRRDITEGRPGTPLLLALEVVSASSCSVGDRMPQTGSPLDTVDLTNIRNWISQGALNN